MRRTIPLAVILLAALAVFFGGRPKKTPPAIARGVRLNQLEVGRLEAPTAAALLTWLAPVWDRPPADAGIDHATGAVHPGRPGRRLDVARTLASLLAAGPGQEVAPVLKTIKPHWPAQTLQNLSTPLSSFQTTVTGSANRLYNLNLAASLLNNTLVLPDHIFSFNAVVGPYDAGRGYRDAPVIVDDRYTMGKGGGVCQLSSTLYQAVHALGLPVVERHGHSLPVPYLQAGRDATVASNLDFRFLNDLATPLVVKAALRGDRLTVTILGRAEFAGYPSPA